MTNIVNSEIMELISKCQIEDAEEIFGKNYHELTISECPESEFKLWWENNKSIPYDSYYYEAAQFVWDQSVNISQIP